MRSTVDIIIRSKDGKDMLARLLQSIAVNTPDDAYRIILVDDGSKEPLVDKATEFIDYYIRNAKPLGAVTATNLGLSVSFTTDSRYVLIMDNDTEIPQGDDTWLQRMTQELEQHDDCACVGATSNFVNRPQHILAVPQTYTGDWSDERRAGIKDNAPSPWFVSFAVLFRKQVLLQVGLWDEQYNPGNFEDTDYAIALRRAGWTCRVARSVYIHHKGHATFGEKFEELFRTNKSKFAAKWGFGTLWDMGIIPTEEMVQIMKAMPR